MMDKQEREQLYNTAWKHWGSDMQVDILIEEMAELMQAFLKDRRHNNGEQTILNYPDVFEEYADVIICMEQLKVRFEQTKFLYISNKPLPRPIGTMWDCVEEIKEKKLLRLKERLMVSMIKKHEDISGLENVR